MADTLNNVNLTCAVAIEWYNTSGVVTRKLKVKQGTIGLYRNEFRELFLFITLKESKHKFLLKAVSVHKKFMSEGKASIKFPELNLNVFLSNAPATHLAAFLKVMYIKLTSFKESPKASVRDKLLSIKSETFEDISPLNNKDLTRTKTVVESRSNSKKRLAYHPVKTKEEPMAKKVCLKSRLLLSPEQKGIVDAVLSGSNVFFTGGAGTGKTYLLRTIIDSMPPDECVATASTGAAACLFGGITLHSFAGIGTGEGSLESCLKLASRPAISQTWRKCKHLIIDEISMVNGAYFEKLDAVARHTRGCPDKPFGGMQLIVCGDFFQLPPVSRSAQKNFCFSSSAWEICRFSYFSLQQVHRQADPKFISILNSIRLGIVTPAITETLQSTSSQDIESGGVLATRLCSLTKEAIAINQSKLALLPGESKLYEATDIPSGAGKLLDDCTPVQREVILKVGAQVMLLKNINISKGLVNGARGLVESISSSGDPVIKFISGEKCNISYETWSVRASNGVIYIRKQLPLRLAWAFSIHKSQGLTLDCVEMCFHKIFEAGQAYVALSRAKSLKSLRVIGFDEKQVWADPQVLRFYKKLNSYIQEFIPLGKKR